jgi:integrase
MCVWTAEQLHAFLKHVAEDRLFALWRLAATTGLRRGELIGLRWTDIDLSTAQLLIARQRVKGGGQVSVGAPKSRRKGRRTIKLDPMTTAALREHRRAQVAERMALGAAYHDEGFVFCHLDGTPFHPDGITQRFQRHVRQAGLPHIRLHDLRHSYATLSLRAGVAVKVVSERLGHAKPSITSDIYQHAIPELQEDAALRIAAMIDRDLADDRAGPCTG